MRAVIVEDSKTHALMLRQLLERDRVAVDAVTAADAAIDLAAAQALDLVIVDAGLPSGSGFELCVRIRKMERHATTPILLLVGDDAYAEGIRGLEVGATAYAAKYGDRELLLTRIRGLLFGSKIGAPPASGSELKGARILAIDDSRTYLHYLATVLKPEGCALEIADEGRRGLDRLASTSFDCALVDLMMPELDGIEVCRHVDKLRRVTSDPVALLMLTGQESSDAAARALAAGADDFVGKSADAAVLKARIRALLRRRAVLVQLAAAAADARAALAGT